MAAAAQVAPLAWQAAHVAALAPAVAASPWPMDGSRDVLDGSMLFEFTHGRAHALLAVRPVALAGGRRLDVVGLVSDGERMQGAAIDAAAVRIARELDCKALAMCTQRAHVIKTCARAGWEITGVVMARVVSNVK